MTGKYFKAIVPEDFLKIYRSSLEEALQENTVELRVLSELEEAMKKVVEKERGEEEEEPIRLKDPKWILELVRRKIALAALEEHIESLGEFDLSFKESPAYRNSKQSEKALILTSVIRVRLDGMRKEIYRAIKLLEAAESVEITEEGEGGSSDGV